MSNDLKYFVISTCIFLCCLFGFSYLPEDKEISVPVTIISKMQANNRNGLELYFVYKTDDGRIGSLTPTIADFAIVNVGDRLTYNWPMSKFDDSKDNNGAKVLILIICTITAFISLFSGILVYVTEEENNANL